MVRSVIKDKIKMGEKEAFYVQDLTDVEFRINLFRKLMPRVELFYAYKAHPDKELFKTCMAHKTGFDVASIFEMDTCIAAGVTPDQLIFANPVKSEEMIKAALKHGVSKMTFDCVEELHKIKKWYPAADCVLRIAVEGETGALYNLNEKYGAHVDQAKPILRVASKLGLRVKGIAFHVGSGGVNFEMYESSIRNARKIFDLAVEMGLEEMNFLDIGGGFTCHHGYHGGEPNPAKNFEFVAPQISALIDQLFPDPSVQVIAEPGRLISESVAYLTSRINLVKTTSERRGYYLNSGIYTGYMVRIYGEKMDVEPVDKAINKRQKFLTTFWGPTCDCCDWILKDKMHPKYHENEWVLTKNHGAYHKDLSMRFNGFALPETYYIH